MKTGEIIRKIRPSLILAFTATADSRICRGIEKYIFSGAIPYTVHASADRENASGVRKMNSNTAFALCFFLVSAAARSVRNVFRGKKNMTKRNVFNTLERKA